ncbi:hypothetical protein T265_09191 [Opisthorchis viverrini]|uniref:Uncharacterized protein n=1 Tax=Opisthorchis viverrini TaxID=6198 RepID=A0A074Z6I3_OPIVI|nr:hypothetical protein T265_09191 [Opisthorchis viverrini]KER22786.1 hypothetical protein T265_09191 [Opisthorchis viverrini]
MAFSIIARLRGLNGKYTWTSRHLMTLAKLPAKQPKIYTTLCSQTMNSTILEANPDKLLPGSDMLTFSRGLLSDIMTPEQVLPTPKYVDKRSSRTVLPSDWSLMGTNEGEEIGLQVCLMGNTSLGQAYIWLSANNVATYFDFSLSPECFSKGPGSNHNRLISVSSFIFKYFHKEELHQLLLVQWFTASEKCSGYTLSVPNFRTTRMSHGGWDTVRWPKPRQQKSAGEFGFEPRTFQSPYYEEKNKGGRGRDLVLAYYKDTPPDTHSGNLDRNGQHEGYLHRLSATSCSVSSQASGDHAVPVLVGE